MHRDAQIVESRDQPDAKMIDHAVRQENARIDPEDADRRRREPYERRDEQRRAVIDPRDRGELSRDVEPRREPAPRIAAKAARPVIRRA